MKIEIKNLDSVIKKIEKYRDTLDSRFHKFLEELGRLGVQTAGVRFAQATYDGDNDVTVSDPIWIDEKSLIIEATGSTVWFIEFGTGIVYADDHPKANEMGAVRGAYGKGRGRRTTWGYYGTPGSNGQAIKSTDNGDLILTHGNPSNKVMYETGKEMRKAILETAKRVFKE